MPGRNRPSAVKREQQRRQNDKLARLAGGRENVQAVSESDADTATARAMRAAFGIKESTCR